MRVKVSLMGDVCSPVPGFLTTHQGVPPPAPAPLYPPNSPLRCLESPTPMMWSPGLALQQNKLTKTVFHKAQFIALEHHDCGHMIPHITIPPANIKLPLDIAFSKRKVMFTSSKVRADGAQVAATEMLGPPVPLPMLCCGSPVPIPNGYPAFNSLHTVSVGITIGDILAGLLAIAAEILGEVLCEKLKLKNAEVDALAAKLLGASTPEEWALKQALGWLSGCARIALTGEGNLTVEGGSGWAKVNAAIDYAKEGRLKLGTEVYASGLQGGYAYSVNPGGTTSHQFTASAGGLDGADSIQSTTTSGTNDRPAQHRLQRTSTSSTISPHVDRPSDTTVSSWQQTTTTPANGRATSTTVEHTDSSSPAGSWGTPL